MRASCLLLLGGLVLYAASEACPSALAQPAPQPPTEEEYNRRRGLTRDESDLGGYQRDSVESFGSKALRAASWVKESLSGLHITPARLMLGLGILGLLFTWNKNKKKIQWAVIWGFALLLILFGAAAVALGWPYLS